MTENEKPTLGFGIEIRLTEKKSDELADALLSLVSPATNLLGAAGQIGGLVKDYAVHQRAVLRDRLKGASLLVEEATSGKLPPAAFCLEYADKASRDDIDSQLRDMWVGLFASASTRYHAGMLSYIDILSRVGHVEADLLSGLCVERHPAKATGVSGDRRFSKLPAELPDDVSDGGTGGEYWKSLEESWVSTTDYLAGIRLGRFHNSKSFGTSFFYDESYSNNDLSFEILEREGLIRKYEVVEVVSKSVPSHRTNVTAVIYTATRLGYDLITSCLPEEEIQKEGSDN